MDWCQSEKMLTFGVKKHWMNNSCHAANNSMQCLALSPLHSTMLSSISSVPCKNERKKTNFFGGGALWRITTQTAIGWPMASSVGRWPEGGTDCVALYRFKSPQCSKVLQTWGNPFYNDCSCSMNNFSKPEATEK